MVRSRTSIHALLLALVGCAGLWASSAQAVPMLFTDEASFAAAASSAGISLSTDSFENLPGGAALSPIARPGFSVSQTAGGAFGVEVSPSTFVIDGNVSVTTSSQTGPLVFALGAAGNAFGLLLGDLDVINGDVTLAVGGGTAIPAGMSPGQNQGLFIGVIDTDTAFSQISIDRTIDGEVYVFDAVRFGQVPEPGTAILMGVALAGLATVGRRRSRFHSTR